MKDEATNSLKIQTAGEKLFLLRLSIGSYNPIASWSQAIFSFIMWRGGRDPSLMHESDITLFPHGHYSVQSPAEEWKVLVQTVTKITLVTL